MAQFYYDIYNYSSDLVKTANKNISTLPTRDLNFDAKMWVYDYFTGKGHRITNVEYFLEIPTGPNVAQLSSVYVGDVAGFEENQYVHIDFSKSADTYPMKFIGRDGTVIGSYRYFVTSGKILVHEYNVVLKEKIKTIILDDIGDEVPYEDSTKAYWAIKSVPVNVAPTISGRDLDLGGIKQPFNHSYSIDDKDLTQELSITITKSWLSSSETIGNAVRNQNYITGINQDEFNSLELNKQHKITITVTDGAGAKYSRYISFRRINSAPTVTVNRDMGEQNAPFDITYRVTDLENDIVNIEFLYEGEIIGNQSNVDKEIDLTWSIPNLEYIKIPNGYSEITIRAIDVNGASSASLVGFTKNVHGCGIEHGIEVDEIVDFCIADCKRELAKELDEENVEILKVQACNNYGDDSPNWEDIPLGKIYRFVNKTAINTPKVGVRFEVLSDPQIGNSYLSNFVFKWGWEE